MFDSRRFRRLLAVDAALTALAGLLVFRWPGLVTVVASRDDRLEPLADARTASLLGAAVAVFGVSKGLLYARLLRRLSDRENPRW